MVIQKLIIDNFRGISHLELNPSDLNAYVGVNGAGKSSITDAIIYVLSGNMPKDAVHNGALEMSVEAVMDTQDTIRRSYSPEGQKVVLNGRTCSIKALEEYLTSITNVDKEIRKTIISTDIVAALKAEELGELMLTYMNMKFDFNKVIEYCGNISPAAVLKLKTVSSDGDTYLPLNGEFNLPRVEEVFTKLAGPKNKKAERLMLKGDIQILSAKSLYKDAIPPRSSEQVKAELEKILQTEGAVKMAQVALLNWKKSKKAYDDQNAMKEKIRKQIEEIKCFVPNPERLAMLQDAKKKINNYILENQTTIRTLQTAQTNAESMLRNLNKNECLCFKGLACTTDKSGMKKSLEDQIGETKANMELIEKNLKEKRALLEQAEAQIERYQKNEMDYQKKVLLKKQLENLEKSKIEVPEQPEEITVMDYSAEKRKLYEEKTQIERYQEAQKYGKLLEEKKNELQVVEELVNIFKPKGIFKENLISYYMSVLQQCINEEVAVFRPDFQVQLKYDSGIHVLCSAKSGQGFIPYHSASRGEQVVVIYAIVYLLNSLSGVGTLILDDLNHLDSASFELLANLLSRKKFDQVFVNCTNMNPYEVTLEKYGFQVINL